MSKLSASPPRTKPSSPQVQSNANGLSPRLAMLKIRVTGLGSLRRGWLIASAMPGSSPLSAGATTAAAVLVAVAPPVVVGWAWLSAFAWPPPPPPPEQPAASRAKPRARGRGSDRHAQLVADLRIRRILRVRRHQRNWAGAALAAVRDGKRV